MEESVENTLVQDDAAIDAEKGEESGFYKSQEEVNRAFKKRLEREKKKWEQSLKNNGGDKAQAQESSEEKEDPVEEELSKIGEELSPFLEKIEDEGELFEEEKQKEKEDFETQEFVRTVMNEVRELEQIYEELDLTEELNDPLFTHMLKEGQPLKKVYDYFKPERNRQDLYRQIEREVTERIRARNARPSSIARANASNASYDISRLTQKDIEEIDRRVRRGERVVL